MRKVHLILTIGGGFLGLAITLQGFFTAKEFNAPFFLLLAAFVTLYGYGIFAGLRLVDNPDEKKHLAVFYWLQVPWISSPILVYRFASGFHVTCVFVESKLGCFFRVGSDWQVSLFRPAPWGIGVNAFALALVVLLFKKAPTETPKPTPFRDRMAGKTPQRSIRLDAEGFTIISDEKTPVSVRWIEVREIIASKHDLFSVDEIGFEFCIGDAGSYVWAGEDDDGFAALRSEVESRFGIDPAWFGKIAPPPFAENRATLWKRT
jgi:hypothetical protein